MYIGIYPFLSLMNFTFQKKKKKILIFNFQFSLLFSDFPSILLFYLAYICTFNKFKTFYTSSRAWLDAKYSMFTNLLFCKILNGRTQSSYTKSYKPKIKKQIIPSRHAGEAMHQNRPLFSTPINEVKTNIQIIQQVLTLHISKRHRHPHQLQILPRVFQRVQNLLGRQGTLGPSSIRTWTTITITTSIRATNINLLDFLSGDNETATPFGEKGYRNGAEDR